MTSQNSNSNSNSNPNPNLNYFDLETTGLNHFHDKITEFAFIKEGFGKSSQEFTSLVNPEKNISNFITRITGISNEMVVNSPKFSELATKIIAFINEGGSTPYLIAHNGDGFDKLVLKSHFNKLNIKMQDLNWKTIDTLSMAKKLYPYMFKYNLKDLMSQLGLETKEAHRAMNDTIMVHRLYFKMCTDLDKKEKLSDNYCLFHPEYVWNFIND